MFFSLVRWGAYPAVMGAVVAALLLVLSGALPAWPGLAVIAAGGIAAVAWLERVQPFERAWQADQGDLGADVVHALVNLGLLSTVAWALHAGASVLSLPQAWPTAWPLWAQALLAGAVIDLGLYTMHRISHHWPWAWRLHAIHHSAERLYWLNGERRHPLSAILIAGPGLVAVAALGAPPLAISAWLALLAVHLAFQHANLDYTVGPLRGWIGVAESHRWHHKRDYQDAQVNFGEFWLVWDRLFGTFLNALTRLGADAVGLQGSPAPRSYLGQMVWPFSAGAELSAAFEDQLRRGRVYLARGEHDASLAAYEAAHILGQSYTILHVRSHLALLHWGWRTRSLREVLGQVTRTIAAALVTWIWVPRGNPGVSRISAFESHPVPADLALLLDRSAR